MEQKDTEELIHEEESDAPLTEAEADDLPALDYDEEAIAVSSELPEACCTSSELENNGRYTELRALGLTPKEAYLATSYTERAADNRSHLKAAVPKSAAAPINQMSRRELDMARSVFGELDDNELRRLFKRVTR